MTSIIRPLKPRDSHEPHRVATPLELLFDLVSVIAIATAAAGLHHAIAEAHATQGVISFVLAFFAIWWAWMNYTWFASAYDNDDTLFRLLTMVIMAGSLTMAAGIGAMFEHFDLTLVVIGYIIMRIGMVVLWLRAARHDTSRRATALTYAGGIAAVQVLWIVYVALLPMPPTFGYALFACGIVLELAVPVVAERKSATPWHRHHIIERYGLLNIIVLGEVLLSISLMIGKLYDGHFDMALVTTAVSGLVIVFVVWWLYFIEEEHLASTALYRAFIWGYGHIFIFASGALLAAGLGAYMDVLTHHSETTAHVAAAYINIPAAIYLFTLWFIRDRFTDRGWRSHVLLAGAALFVAMAFAGPPPWVTALAAIGLLVARSPGRERVG